jgi:hypothetical protein
MALGITMDNRPGGNHLGIQHRLRTDKTHKIATVAVSPVEHRGNTEFSIYFQWVNLIIAPYNTRVFAAEIKKWVFYLSFGDMGWFKKLL